MKRLIVLDLDNTLIYCTYSSGHKVKMLFEYKDSLSVYERPYATEFVQRCHELGDVMIFTMSELEYAQQISEHLNIQPLEIFSNVDCLFREGISRKRLPDEYYNKYDEIITEVILLDKIQKALPINDDAARMLKKKRYIEGRKPNYYISAHIAEATNQKAKYIKNRGFKDEHYKKMVLDFLCKYGKATKEEIDNLLLDILPDVLDEGQKKNKVRNLIYALHKRDQTIENKGTTRNPLWVLSLSNSAKNKMN